MKPLRRRPGRRRDGRRERRRGASDVELLGLGENGVSGRIFLEQVDLESLTGGPAGGRCIHGGGTRGSGDVFLQNDVDAGVDDLGRKEITQRRKKGGKGLSTVARQELDGDEPCLPRRLRS